MDLPGMDSNLSKVPPVKPSPLPDLFATLRPKAAILGQSAIEVLSPTPSVECLSTFTPGILLKSKVSPEFLLASLRLKVSCLVLPFKRMAMSKAALW